MKYSNFDEFLNDIGSKYASRIAYRYLKNDGIEEKTYFELNMDSYYISTYFLKYYQEETKIALIGQTSYEWIAYYMGIVRSKNVAVTIDKNLPLDDILKMLAFSDTKVVFLTDSLSSYKEKILEKFEYMDIFSIEEDFEDLVIEDYRLSTTIKKDTLAQLMFTSGTTGTPKVVTLTHENILSSTTDSTEGISYNTTVLSILPINHCYELFYGHIFELNFGATVCINDKIENFVKNMNIFKPSLMVIVPLIAAKLASVAKQIYDQIPKEMLVGKNRKQRRQMFSKFYEAFGGRLEALMIGGADIDMDIVTILDLAGIYVLRGYGATETAATCFTNPFHDIRIDSVGIPFIKNLEYKIVDKELWVKGPSVTKGYYKNDEANKEFFTKDGYYKTGDLVELLDDERHIKFIGRKKNMIVLSNGENVFPEEIEQVILKNKNVLDVIVFEQNNQICSAVFTKGDRDSINETIRSFNSSNPVYKNITKTYFTENDFLKNPAGKTLRTATIESLSKKEKKDVKYPSNEIEQKIYNLIQEELKIYDFNTFDNLFSLGMDSLTALNVAEKLKIKPQDIYNYNSVEALASFINSNTDEDKPDEYYLNDLIASIPKEHIELENDSYFLTGATGFLGSHILNHLVKQDRTVYCLVRNRKKLEDLYRFYFNEDLPEKVKVYTGDVTADNLGLEPSDYSFLTKQVNHVIHTAAIVNHIGSFDDFSKTNVEGTKNVIRFTKDSDATLHHASTYSVSGLGLVKAQSNEVFNESKLFIGQNYRDNIYVHTKYLAEKAVLEAMKNGLKCNIYRIGSLSWRKDGQFQVNEEQNGLINRFLGLKKMKMYSESFSDYAFDFTPVDECSLAFVKLMQRGDYNEIYHLFNPNVVGISQFVELFGECKEASIEEMNTFARVENDKNIAIYMMYNNLMEDISLINIDCRYTLEKLQNTGFLWSKIDGDYLKLKL